MIKRDDKKRTPKQFAYEFWIHHLEGTCAWGEDDDAFEGLTEREYDQVRVHLDAAFRRMLKMLNKSAGGK